jgi:glycosidase
VAAQSAAPDSLLARYRTLIRLRLDHEALRRGATALVEASSPFLAYVRSTEKETLLVLHNLAPVTAPVSVRVPPALAGRYLARDVAGARLPVFASVAADGSFVAPPVVIGPYATLVLSLSRL